MSHPKSTPKTIALAEYHGLLRYDLDELEIELTRNHGVVMRCVYNPDRWSFSLPVDIGNHLEDAALYTVGLDALWAAYIAASDEGGS